MLQLLIIFFLPHLFNIYIGPVYFYSWLSTSVQPPGNNKDILLLMMCVNICINHFTQDFYKQFFYFILNMLFIFPNLRQGRENKKPFTIEKHLSFYLRFLKNIFSSFIGMNKCLIADLIFSLPSCERACH